MKKAQTKRSSLGYAKPKDLLKPFNFCCDVNHQDQGTRYNPRIPPLVTSLTEIMPKIADGPDLKFRLQDIGKPTVTTSRIGTHKIKSHATIGRRGKRRGRGPLRWYIEDEIALARDIIANEKAEKRAKAEKHRRGLSKAKKKRRRSKNRKSHEVANDNRGNDEEDFKDIDKEA